MTKTPAKDESTPSGQVHAFSRWLKRHPIAFALVLAALGGLALGWNWLAASGLLVVALAGFGCLLMCVFGLHGGRDKGAGGE